MRGDEETISCGTSDIAWKTSETALMNVANTALGWIEGREERKELLVINFRDLKLEKSCLNSNFENYKPSYLLRAVKS